MHWEEQIAGLREIEEHIDTVAEAGAGLLLAVFCVYQAYFHRLSERVDRIADVGHQQGS